MVYFYDILHHRVTSNFVNLTNVSGTCNETWGVHKNLQGSYHNHWMYHHWKVLGMIKTKWKNKTKKQLVIPTNNSQET